MTELPKELLDDFTNEKSYEGFLNEFPRELLKEFSAGKLQNFQKESVDKFLREFMLEFFKDC